MTGHNELLHYLRKKLQYISLAKLSIFFTFFTLRCFNKIGYVSGFEHCSNMIDIFIPYSLTGDNSVQLRVYNRLLQMECRLSIMGHQGPGWLKVNEVYSDLAIILFS